MNFRSKATRQTVATSSCSPSSCACSHSSCQNFSIRRGILEHTRTTTRAMKANNKLERPKNPSDRRTTLNKTDQNHARNLSVKPTVISSWIFRHLTLRREIQRRRGVGSDAFHLVRSVAELPTLAGTSLAKQITYWSFFARVLKSPSNNLFGWHRKINRRHCFSCTMSCA